MTPLRPAVLTLALVLAGGGLAACGDEDGGGATSAAAPASTAATPDTAQGLGGANALPAPTAPTATFVFDDGELKPSLLKVPRATSVRLVVISADGRPHGVVVQTPGERVRLQLAPGRRAEAQLTDLKPGSRLRVVPDGIAEPAVLQLG